MTDKYKQKWLAPKSQENESWTESACKTTKMENTQNEIARVQTGVTKFGKNRYHKNTYKTKF